MRCNLETKQKHIIWKSWVNVCRFLLAAVFIFSGFVKAVDPLGSFYKLFLHKVSFFMTKSLYVGNLPWSATEDDVRDLFAPYGEVTSVKLVSDRETGRARGFGFVEMASEGVQAAVEALDNFSFSGRNLKVNEARPREARPSYSRY